MRLGYFGGGAYSRIYGMLLYNKEDSNEVYCIIIIIIIHLFQIPLYTMCNNNNYIKIKKLNDQKSTLY